MTRRLSPGFAPFLFASALASYFVFPDYLGLITQIFVLAMFAMSYDLLQGHGGIVSLGHAAFFGLGAYSAAILAHAGLLIRCLASLLRSWSAPPSHSCSRHRRPWQRSDPALGDARRRLIVV